MDTHRIKVCYITDQSHVNYLQLINLPDTTLVKVVVGAPIAHECVLWYKTGQSSTTEENVSAAVSSRCSLPDIKEMKQLKHVFHCT